MDSADHQATRDRAIQWMNRGHERMRACAGMEALVAYAHAIALLRTVPLAENPSWANSLGAALMNYGQLLHRVHGLARADDALRAFADAIALLTDIAPDEIPWARRNLAGTHLNRANFLLDLARCAAASADAHAALDLVTATERTNALDADLALKARRALCDALGQLVVGADAAHQEAIATDAADVVDDALAVIRVWTARGESTFAPLAVRFFRFGVELYRHHQPHFLVEFIEENFEVAPAHADELGAIARNAVDGALADGAAPARFTFDDPSSERALSIRRDLLVARERVGLPFPTA